MYYYYYLLTLQIRITIFIFPTSYSSDRDHPVYSVTVFNFASFCLDADQVCEVLKIEEQQLIAKIQEGQTLQRRAKTHTCNYYNYQQTEHDLHLALLVRILRALLTFDVLNTPSLTLVRSSRT